VSDDENDFEGEEGENGEKVEGKDQNMKSEFDSDQGLGGDDPNAAGGEEN
jgi:hypothetical protein